MSLDKVQSGAELARALMAAQGGVRRHDDLHLGGRAAVRHMLDGMALAPGVAVLDIGCGLGGPARLMAGEGRLRVSAIDIDPVFIEAAQILSRDAGLDIDYRCADAYNLPFADATFDAAMTIHVGMAVADKDCLYREAARVLRSGGVFALYDVMAGPRAGDVPPSYPMPWSATAAGSFLVTMEDTQRMLGAAGFDIVHTDDRTASVIGGLEKAVESGEISPVRPADWPVRQANLLAGIANQSCCAVLVLARKKG